MAHAGVRSSVVRGAVVGAAFALLLAALVYAYLVFVVTYPPGLEGDAYMAVSLYLSLLGAPTSWLIMSQLDNVKAPAIVAYAVYLAPILLNGAVIGALVAAASKRLNRAPSA